MVMNSNVINTKLWINSPSVLGPFEMSPLIFVKNYLRMITRTWLLIALERTVALRYFRVCK